MHQDIERILLSEEQLNAIVCRLGAEISREYADKNLLLLCILKGSVVFMGDLMKRITVPAEIDFMRVSSYGGDTQTTGNINILLDLVRKDIPQCDIVIVEDIIDSGHTVAYLKQYLAFRGARSVKVCTLLDKPDRREVEIAAEYVGAVIPDAFVVGYGLDYDEQYRALPYVGVLKSSVYAK